jgi:hypothetical protein
MNKIILVSSIILFLIASCKEELTDNPLTNKPPKSFISIFPDTSISQQQSRLKLNWWGDDPDGLVIGYFITWDNVKWYFTTKNDSTISFPIKGADTTLTFKVSAVDNSGNGKYDNQIIVNGINFGPEPFTDLDSNKIYSNGEPFTDCGAVDPNPASIKLPLKNSPPEIKFLVDKNSQTITTPDTTFPVASFGWTASDIDGDQTITSIYIALNDTSQKIEIPGTTRFVTLIAKPPYSSNTVNCDVYLGSSISTPYNVKLPNLKLNAQNRFYVYAKDIAGSFSKINFMPDTNKVWYVKKPKGDILIIDDYIIEDNAATFYSQIFDSLNLGNRIDSWDIARGRTSTTSGYLLPKFLSPMFTETLKLFKYIFWYTDDNSNQSLEPAQLSTKNFITAGGKILFSMIFPQSFDSRGLSDFLPIDSLGQIPIIVFPNTSVNPTDTASSMGYPNLQRDDNPNPVARIRNFFVNPISGFNLYKLNNQNNFIVGFKAKDSKLVFMGIPLHRTNGTPFKTKTFFQKVFFGEFGVTP